MTEETLFHAALAKSNPAERRAFLDEACAGRPELRSAVEALLAAHVAPGPFLVSPPIADATVASSAGPADPAAKGEPTSQADRNPPRSSITIDYQADIAPSFLIAGRYTLQEKIGEGGMGEVWVAKQSEPVKRKVALKLIKAGMDSRAVLARFEQERQALAMMDHPNIAKVFDAGLTPGGQPFFVMELVNGLPLHRFCDELRLTPKERLELFVPICQAVQHAHQKGIVHRDLKPANILVTMIDAKPIPKVIDFGVAKATSGRLTEESMSTQFGAVVGTFEYMSPEQAGFSSEDIDTRADIYSLGVILYEMLTGLRPIDAARLKKAALTEMIRIIREEEPSKPSTRLSTDASLPSLASLRQTDPRKLMSILRGELDWVVMKCLEKRRERRYETANALARDIQRYLADEPVEARPPSAGYRFGKFVSRHKGQVIAACLVLLALVAGMIGTSIGLVRAEQARDAEVTQRRRAEQANRAEVAQRRRAEERERQAIDAVKRFGDAVAGSDALKNNPELSGLRSELLKAPLEFFKALRERLQAENDTRPESLARLARAASDLGKVTNEIGDKSDALIVFRESRAIFQKLADANPADAEFQSGLGSSHHNIGTMLRQTGKPAEALASFEAAVAIRRKLADANPADADLQNHLAKSLNDAGAVLGQTGKPAEALESLNSALEILQKLADANPTAAEFQNRLAGCHNNIGVLQNWIGRPAKALESYQSALAIHRKLARDYPADKSSKSGLAGCYNNIGVLLSETGKPAEALESYQAALEIRRESVAANPAVTSFQSELADSHNSIGLELSRIGKLAEAIESLNAALTIHRKLANDHPKNPDFASRLGITLGNMGMIDLDGKRYEAARVRLREAIDWQRKALAAYPVHPTYRRNLVKHLRDLIKASRGLGDAEGLAEAERALAEFRDSNPVSPALDARLSAIMKDHQQPKDNAERRRLAERANDRALYATAARLWSEALETDPKLSDDRRTRHRYNAACAAALAGCGKGKDEPAPDDAAKAKLRKQALDWLNAELAFWKTASESGTPVDRSAIAKTLDDWRQDPDLVGIRDAKELTTLPDAERNDWQRLWAEVEALLTKNRESQ